MTVATAPRDASFFSAHGESSPYGTLPFGHAKLFDDKRSGWAGLTGCRPPFVRLTRRRRGLVFPVGGQRSALTRPVVPPR